MDTENLCDVLATATCQVLENAAFVFAERLDGPPEGSAVPMLEARIRFEGTVSGDIRLAASQTFCASVAGDMLGEDESEISSEAVLGELLNMVVGTTLADMLGPGAQYTFGVPEVVAVPASGGKPLQSPNVEVWLETEEGEAIHAGVCMNNGESL